MLLRHGRGAARAVPSCAGAYVSGSAGSNECPAGSVRIEAESACRTAATATGKTAGSPLVATLAVAPKGCYYSTITNRAFFNADAVGADFVGNGGAVHLLCAVTNGAPPPHWCACACAAARVCAARARCAGVLVQRRHVGARALCGLGGAAETDGGALRYGHGQYV